jgi:hypothetical protein
MANDQQNPFTSGQQGWGSAENRGEGRDAQRAPNTQLDEQLAQNVADEAGLGRDRITDLDELGALSGRDDYAGGSGDDMSSQSTNEETDR